MAGGLDLANMAGAYVGMEEYKAVGREAGAIKGQAIFEATQLEILAKLSELDAKDAIEAGRREKVNLKQRGKQLIGQQRVALAAQGINIDEGSAAYVQQETEKLVELDALQIENNAWRQAWGLEMEANTLRNQAAMTMRSGSQRAKNTFATGGLNAIGSAMSTAGAIQDSALSFLPTGGGAAKATKGKGGSGSPKYAGGRTPKYTASYG